MAAWKEAKVRSEGLKNSRPRIFPASACGSGRTCSRSASCNSSTTCSRDRSARSRKFCIGLKIFQCRAQPVDVFLFEYEGGQQTQNGWISRRARQDVLGQQRLLYFLGRFVEPQPMQETQSLEVHHRAHLAGPAQVRGNAG